MNELRERTVTAAESVASEMLADAWQEAENLLGMCPVMFPILRPTEHRRNFLKSSV
jgi:hypothetical protein